MQNLLHFEAARLWLVGIHPIAPWAVLAALFWGLDHLLDATGATAKLEKAVTWGPLAARTLDTLPFVVLGAAWPAVSSGDLAVDSAVYGALAAALRPVVVAAKAWVDSRNASPPDSGTPGAGPSLLPLLLVLGCLCSGASTGCLTKQETACVAQVEAVETLAIGVHCVPLDGQAYDDCIDEQGAKFDPLAKACFQAGAK